MFDKVELARSIGDFFGSYYETNGKFCIDSGSDVFTYDSIDALLVDWVETLVESHHDAHYIDEQGNEHNSWENEIVFIYSDVIGKFPTGVRPVDNKEGRTWKSSVDVYKPGETPSHCKNFHLGTHTSIVDAICKREEFMSFYKDNRNVSLDELSVLANKMRVEAKELRTPHVKCPHCGASIDDIIKAANSRVLNSNTSDCVNKEEREI